MKDNTSQECIMKYILSFCPSVYCSFFLSSEITGKVLILQNSSCSSRCSMRGSVWPGRVITMNAESLLGVRVQVCLPQVNSFSPWEQLSVQRCNWYLPAQRGDGQNALCAKWELQQGPNWMSLTVCSHPGIHSKSCVQKIKISYYAFLFSSSEVCRWSFEPHSSRKNWRVRRLPSWQGSVANTTDSRGWRRWTGLVWGGQTT